MGDQSGSQGSGSVWGTVMLVVVVVVLLIGIAAAWFMWIQPTYFADQAAEQAAPESGTQPQVDVDEDVNVQVQPQDGGSGGDEGTSESKPSGSMESTGQ